MTRRLFVCLSAVAALSVLVTLQAAHEGVPHGREHVSDEAAAARYLDTRMDLWWQNAKRLKTATSEVRCLSCHTAVPYTLVRPALRKAQGVASQTVHETRIVETARARVAYDAADQPYYDHTDDKKTESRGVEAVLNAFVLTAYDTSASGTSAHTRAAMTRLWQVQRGDGAWDWFNFGLEPYEAPDSVFYGASLAALAAGSDAGRRASADATGQAGIERLTKYFRSTYASQRLFNRTWALLASTRLTGILTPEDRAALLAELRSRQRADGGWSLNSLGPWRWTHQAAPFTPPGTVDSALLERSDGYATGLIVHAMRQAGAPREDEAVRKGQQWLRAQQTAERAGDPAWAPWRAHSLNFDREHGGAKGEPWRRMFMSDLATAFAVLALL
jgi:squalene-hopene/tetraprenyl-beta-curcumene cyclase